MAWARVQSNSTAATSSAVSSVTCTYTAGLTSGTKLIAVATTSTQTGSADTVASVKDGAGNSLTLIGRKSQGSPNILTDVSLWAMDTPAGDAGAKPALTATLSAGTANMAMLIQEVSGLAAGDTLAAMVDGTLASLGGNGGSSTGSPSYTSSALDEYLVAVYGDDGGPVTWTKPAGLTADANSLNSQSYSNCALAYGNSTGGAEAGSWGLSGSAADWGALLVAFKLASGGSTVTGVPAALAFTAAPGTVTVTVPVTGTTAALVLEAPRGEISAGATVTGTTAALAFAAPAGTVTVTPPGPVTSAYHGLFTRGYLQYTDLATGFTLVAQPGGSYHLAPASGEPGLASPPPDGWWDGTTMGTPLQAPAHFTAADVRRLAQRRAVQEIHARIARGEA